MSTSFKLRRYWVALIALLVVAFALMALDGGPLRAGDDGFSSSSAEAPSAAAVVPQAATKQIASAAFHPIDTGAVTKTLEPSGFCASATGIDPNFTAWQLVASVELPVGAVITGYNADIYDNDAAAARVALADIDGNSRVLIGDVSSSGTPGFANIAETITGGHTVVASRALWLIFTSSNAAATSTAVCNVQIEYEIPSDHDNLVFTPLAAPCRIFDTIPAGSAPWTGPLGPVDGAVTFVIAQPSAIQVTAQGGDGACAETAIPSDAQAVSINLIARSPQEQGHIRTAAAGSATQPVVNYSLAAGMNNSSEVTVALSGGGIDVRIGGMAALTDSVDVRGVVLGYYTEMPDTLD